MADKPKQAFILDPQRMQLSEQLRQDWVCTVESGIKIEDIMEPGFWAHKAAQMSPYDHIEVRTDDGSWLAQLLVLGCDRNWARVSLMNKYILTTSDVSLSQAMKHEIKNRGPHLKWCVIRLADQEAVKEQCKTQEEAALWLKEHERTTSMI